MIFGRLTWIGFMIVAFGWAVLLSGAQFFEYLERAIGRAIFPGPIPAPVFAQYLVLTGFGVAILGSLKTGFGALQRFFDALTEKTSQARTQPRQAHAEQLKKVVERGWLRDRAYILFMDGSVEIETMLGRRLFPSLQEAQKFIA